MKLPLDVARCAGIGSEEEGWFEDCEDCLRRTDIGVGDRVSNMQPPAVIAFFCETKIGVTDVQRK